MNLVDSSGWLAYFADETTADFFAEAIENYQELLVPTIILYEVFKRVLQQRGENDALLVIGVMRRGMVAPLDESLALEASRLSIHHKLPMADSIILATARRYDAEIWTQDADFRGLPGVHFIEKG